MSEIVKNYSHPKRRETESGAKYLTVIYRAGIGDALVIGSSAIDQIIKNDESAVGKIDILCNPAQKEIFSYDPRVSTIYISPNIDREDFIHGKVAQVYREGKSFREKLFSDFEEDNELVTLLRSNNYVGVGAGDGGFRFAQQLGENVIYPRPSSIARDLYRLKKQQDAPLSWQTRKTVNHFFNTTYSQLHKYENTALYTNSQFREKAKEDLNNLKRTHELSRDHKILVVNPDSSSDFTRPPVELLAEGINKAAEQEDLFVIVLPGYTKPSASYELTQALLEKNTLVTQLEDTPIPSLHYLAGIIAEADIFITGDTGLMHIAVADKIAFENDNFQETNSVTKIIALFGATNPGLFGYSKKSTILGRGRKEQGKFQPGLFKGHLIPNPEINYFSHIIPDELRSKIVE